MKGKIGMGYLKNFQRVGGIALLLIIIAVIASIINPQFLNAYNVRNILRWTGLFGILSLGAAFVIMSEGIDLSIGSMVGLSGSIAAFLITKTDVPVIGAIIIVLGLAVAIGLFHGILITKLNIQAFVVTLCGLFLYRGMARFLMDDRTQGYGTGFPKIHFLASGRVPSAFWVNVKPPKFFANWSLPMPFLILIALALILAFILNKTVYGQHLKAVGRNESAARYSGIHTHKVIITAYMISAGFAGFGGILFSLDLNTVQPSSMGNMYELYAIAGCVVGGVSLRGGEGTILEVILGTALVRILYNAINVAGVSTQLESVVLGIVILIGVSADEIVQILAARRKVQESMALARKAAEEAGSQAG